MNQRDYTRARGCQLNCLIIVETMPLINPSLTSDPDPSDPSDPDLQFYFKVWIESVDPVADLCLTNQVLYETILSSTAE